jgi:hypothetical protein
MEPNRRTFLESTAAAAATTALLYTWFLKQATK